MKFWFSRGNIFCYSLLLMISLVLAGSVLKDYGFILVFELLPLFLVAFGFVYRHRVFSRISIDDTGVCAKVFWEPIFSAQWSEIKLVGEFSMPIRFGEEPYFVFSKLEDPFPERKMVNIQALAICARSQLRNNILLTQQTPKMRKELFKYFDEGHIINFGTYRVDLNRFV